MTHPQEAWMTQALAAGAQGTPSPNPHVGAVVVLGDEVIAVGHHERAGEDHAEIVALRGAGARARGATLYVTLEPCNHHGRTPPCTDAIVAAGVARVVVGCADPNPHVAGGGVARLRAAGVEVIEGVCESAARALIAPWTKTVTRGLSYVALKLAMSLDGRIATRTGASRWVSGAESRLRVHALRAQSDAVAIGVGTALADDPHLTVRDVDAPSPPRVVFDTKLRLPPHSRLAESAQQVPTWVLCAPDADPTAEAELSARGVDILRCPRSAEGRLDVTAALRLLASRGVVRLLVEGGAELAGSLLAAELADELHVFLAPMLLGPRGRPGSVDWAGPADPQTAPRILQPTWELCGADAYVHGAVAYPPAQG